MNSAQRWLLILAALTALFTYTVALRPTKASKSAGLSAKKTTTTTTTTEEPAITEEEEEDETTDVPASETTTSRLTGIPQIDYVWDPNLPRELNGYNLSDYPFLNSVPTNEEVDFKCHGLHDGFYASIKYNCQLYHHCIDDVRYDFLCANFTAFDQRTFICHFASEVDCKGSSKYWFRNDALYKATTAATTSTSSTTTTTTPIPPPDDRRQLGRPGRPRNRPLRRRRPVDYYYDEEEYDEEYYEERANRRRKQRPRQRRPDFDDYEADTDRFSKKPYSRDRARDEDPEDDRQTYERPRNRPRPNGNANRRKPGATDDRRYQDERKPLSSDDRRKPIDDSRSYSDAGKPANRKRPLDRRPNYDDYEDTKRKPSRQQNEELAEEKRRPPSPVESTSEAVVVRPSGGSIYSVPRVPPRIRRPVPVNERDKFEYATQKPSSTTAFPDEEYYDDYEDEPPKAADDLKKPQPQSSFKDRPRPVTKDTQKPLKSQDFEDEPSQKSPYKRPAQLKQPEPTEEENYEPKDERLSIRDRFNQRGRKPTIDQDTTRDYPREEYTPEDKDAYTVVEREPDRRKPIASRTAAKADVSPDFAENPDKRGGFKYDDDRTRSAVRVAKRPFLPSRGGNPYAARGLQPVGQKSQIATDATPSELDVTLQSSQRLSRPSSPLDEDDYADRYERPRATLPPQVESPQSTLDEIYNSEYDVTLNDALNPTLKSLTSSHLSPSGFSLSSKYTSRQVPEQHFASTQVRSSVAQGASHPGPQIFEDEYQY